MTALVLYLAMRRWASRLHATADREHAALERLQESEARNRLQATALSAAANAVIVTDPKATIEWVNDAFTTMSGYPPTVAVGSTPQLINSGVQD